MKEKKITSLQHPLVKHLTKLRQNRDYRQEHQTVFIFGNKMITELSSSIAFKTLLCKEGFERPSKLLADEYYLVSEDILKKMTGLPSPEELAAVITLPAFSDLKDKSRILALSVSDPGNLGTLIRVALAFGWDGIYLLPHCVDPFNDKSIRASKGACFKIAFQEGSEKNFINFIHEKNIPVYIADMHGENVKNLKKQDQFILLLGNEAIGVSRELQSCGTSISIPMVGSMESLNVSVAGGILMYLLSYGF